MNQRLRFIITAFICLNKDLTLSPVSWRWNLYICLVFKYVNFPNIGCFKAVLLGCWLLVVVFFTFDDSEHDCLFNRLRFIFHAARVNSCIVLPHVADVQVVLAPCKLCLEFSYASGPSLHPAITPGLHTTRLLSPHSAVNRGVTTVQSS